MTWIWQSGQLDIALYGLKPRIQNLLTMHMQWQLNSPVRIQFAWTDGPSRRQQMHTSVLISFNEDDVEK